MLYASPLEEIERCGRELVPDPSLGVVASNKVPRRVELGLVLSGVVAAFVRREPAEGVLEVRKGWTHVVEVGLGLVLVAV